MPAPTPSNLVYETELWQQGYSFIAGIDEAGRGPLAGPVVAAAVILPVQEFMPQITDSKLLTDGNRRKLYECIKQKACSVGVGVVWQHEIDEINILNAALKAMQLAVDDLMLKPDYILVDGNRCPEFTIAAKSIVDGDMLSHSISAASIIAKVYRDDIMIKYDYLYPQYGFARHKGYCTLEHRQAIQIYGPCPIHRQSFRLDYS